jgi:hypothetical protein
MKTRRLAVVVLSAIVLASALIGGCGGLQVEVGESTTVPTIQVSLLIHVSEDDVQWFRDFEVLKGTNAYELTEQATEGELESTYYTSLFSHWVESIMDVPNEAPNYWLIFQWNGSTEQWEPLPVGAGLFSLKDGHVLAWSYTDTSLDPQPVPSVTP